MLNQPDLSKQCLLVGTSRTGKTVLLLQKIYSNNNTGAPSGIKRKWYSIFNSFTITGEDTEGEDAAKASTIFAAIEERFVVDDTLQIIVSLSV